MNTEQNHLLVVDDDPELRDLLRRYLEEHGFQVGCVADGAALEKYLEQQQQVDLVILDLMLPGVDGLSLARSLRSSGDLPIIMLSARGEDVDRIIGLEVGADDYLPKPFNPRELLARIRAVLRRRQPQEKLAPVRASQGQQHQFGPFSLDPLARRLTRGGDEVPLTSAEFKLLNIFIAHPHQLLSRDALMEQLKGYERSSFDRSIDVRVTRLRRKIEPDPASPIYIRTLWGEGYIFSPDGKA